LARRKSSWLLNWLLADAMAPRRGQGRGACFLGAGAEAWLRSPAGDSLPRARAPLTVVPFYARPHHKCSRRAV